MGQAILSPVERPLRFRCRRRQIPGYDGVGKAVAMRTIAKGLILGQSATAQADHFAPPQSKSLTLRVKNLEIAFYSDGTVVVDRYLCVSH